MHVVWMNEAASNIGGAERYVRETAVHLRARGVRSTLLYSVSSRVDASYVASFDGAYPEVDLPRQLRALAPDVIYAHRIDDDRAPLALASSGVPALRFFHDYKLFCPREHKYTPIGHHTCSKTIGLACYPCLGFVQKSPSFPGVKLVSVASLRRGQTKNRALTGFVVGSKHMGDHIAAHGFDRSKIHVLPLYTEPRPITKGEPREPGFGLFVGQLIRGKGVDLLLRALALAPPHIHVLIVGGGKQEAELRSQCSTLNLNRRVTFAGKVAPSDVAKYYARAQFLVMPSRMPEPFGLAGLEALAAGLPVIACDVGAVREWLDDGQNGIAVPSGDVAALAKAMSRLTEDPDLALSMGARGVLTHRERFLPERHINRLYSLFQALAAEEAA